MALPSATFTDPNAGRLEVHFAAEFAYYPGGGDPAWSGTNSWNIVVRCTVTDSSGNVATTYIQFSNSTAMLTLDYPGGNAAWTVAMAHVSHSYGGLGVTSCSKPTITCVLVKK